MRIQHNIPAMSAYRNYTNNTSAVSKNLERLSSGYRINRAGDDAAGLAISEKMRAQITGLNAASKNAKDGISLVKTAEGALQEVHDMLNRMVSLATQSANGTYDDSVDRAQLQKEVDQLRTEINRIADSSNFNGIKLFDGTMEASTTTYEMTGKVDLGILPNTSTHPTSAGTYTILHTAAKDASKTSFEVELENVSFASKGAGGTKVGINVGGAKISVNIEKGGLSGATLATKLAAVGSGKIKINGVTYGMKADGTKLVFTMTDDSLKNVTKAASFNGNFTVATEVAAAATGYQDSGSVNLGAQVINEGNPKVNGNLANTKTNGGSFAALIANGAVADGAALRVGDTTYVFAGKKETFDLIEKAGAGYVAVDISGIVDDDGVLDDDKAQGLGYDTAFNAAGSLLTVAAKDNKMFTVGFEKGGNALTFQEKGDYNGDGKDGRADLTTKEGIQAQLQTGRISEVIHKAAKGDGKGLMLQIGDTAEDFNQLKVSLGDMHCSSLKDDAGTTLASIRIDNQTDAAAAIDVIKAAINQVSDVRGTLGATQNRLDHTINNLSVMTENIQDAEATIRDVDIAEEMMAYTKNNILVQSAQAMLAQANQIPQGVLQLLG